LTERIVARTTNLAIHYVVAVTDVLGAANVPRLMSDNLALDIETTGIANLVDAYVVTTGIAKGSNISAPNRTGSGEVVAVKEMNDIGIDAPALNKSTKSSK
jgi:malate synthase